MVESRILHREEAKDTGGTFGIYKRRYRRRVNLNLFRLFEIATTEDETTGHCVRLMKEADAAENPIELIVQWIPQGHEIPSFIKDEDVTNLTLVSLEGIKANGSRFAPQIVELLRAGMEKLLLPEHRCEVTFEADTGCVELQTAGIFIEPEAIEVASIVGLTQVFGWVVQVTQVRSGYPAEPDDVDLVPVGEARSPSGAAVLALKTLWNMYADHYWEGVGLGEMIADWERDEKDNPWKTEV